MIKLVFCLTRREDVSPEDFYNYWRNEHAAKVVRLAKALDAKRYVQSHTCLPAVNEVNRAGRGLAAPFDGIAELWWDDEEAFIRRMTSPEGIAASLELREDESRFIDLGKSSGFMTTEHPIF